MASKTGKAVHATIPSKLYDQLVKQATEEERTVAVVVARALRAYLSPPSGSTASLTSVTSGIGSAATTT